jgi:hypothetical protein
MRRTFVAGRICVSPHRIVRDIDTRAIENYGFKAMKYSSDGTGYDAKISQDERGFRMFGNLSSRKPRVFVIGDSSLK